MVRRLSFIPAARPARPGFPSGNISEKRRATAGGTSWSTLPPNDATSLTPLEETKLYWGFDIR